MLSLVLKLCTYKADFVGVLKFVKQLFMSCKDYDGLLPFFFFPVIILSSALKRDPREFAVLAGFFI